MRRTPRPLDALRDCVCIDPSRPPPSTCTTGSAPMASVMRTATSDVYARTFPSMLNGSAFGRSCAVNRLAAAIEPLREAHAEQRADGHQHRALDEELTGDRGATGAQRGADRELAPPRVRPHQQKVGDVHAADQQDEQNAPLQEQEGGPYRFHALELDCRDPHLVAAAVEKLSSLRRLRVVHLLLECGHLGEGLLDRGTRGEGVRTAAARRHSARPGLALSGGQANGRMNFTRASNASKSCGATPMISDVSPSSRTVRPSTPGSS